MGRVQKNQRPSVGRVQKNQRPSVGRVQQNQRPSVLENFFSKEISESVMELNGIAKGGI